MIGFNHINWKRSADYQNRIFRCFYMSYTVFVQVLIAVKKPKVFIKIDVT